MNEYGQCFHTKYEGCPPCIHDMYRSAYAKGYLDGYKDAENENKFLTQPTVSCGHEIEWKLG